MLTKIDTGHRKLLIQCDLYGVIMRRAHEKLFKGPDAQQEAELFAKSRHIDDRAIIEPVFELPHVNPPAGTPTIKLADENQELLEMITSLVYAIASKTTPDTAEVKRSYRGLRDLLNRKLR